MKLELDDPAFDQALSQATGHPAPFTAAECRELTGPLFIQQARSLADLRRCPNLHHLELFACDLAGNDWAEAVAGLKHLQSLKIRCSAVTDATALAACDHLTDLELSFTLLQDLTPLLQLARLRRGVLLGNPWTADSYHNLRPKLLRRDKGRELLLEFSGENDWQLARKLFKQGLKLAFSSLDGTRRITVRPGLPLYTRASCDFITDQEFMAEVLLYEVKQRPPDPDKTLAALFNLLDEAERGNPQRTFDFASHRHLGHANRARSCVEQSPLPADWQASLMRFIARFPSMTFFHEDETVIKGIEAMTATSLPAWYAAVRATLAGVMPNRRPLFEFDADTIGRLGGDFRFELNQFNVHWDGRDQFTQANERIIPFTFATSPDAQSLLAFNLADPNDPTIYVYNVESLRDPFYQAEGRSLSDALRPLFPNYASLFDHVAIVTLPGDEVKGTT